MKARDELRLFKAKKRAIDKKILALLENMYRLRLEIDAAIVDAQFAQIRRKFPKQGKGPNR